MLLRALQLASGHDVLEVGAWDGYLAEKLVEHDGVVTLMDRMRFVLPHLRSLFPFACVVEGPQESIPALDASFDRVASLVALHHVNVPAFVREARRVLRPGGRLALVEVERGSSTAKFLEAHVHRRKGIYLTSTEWASMLTDAGFGDVAVESQVAHWRFSAMSRAIEFCRCVFGLECADDEIAGAIETLDPVADVDGISWEWPLLVARSDVEVR